MNLAGNIKMFRQSLTSTRSIINFNILYAMIGVVGLFNLSWWVIPMWLFFDVGNGTVGHRYFGHNNYTVSKFTHWVLCIWCSIAAYATPVYWRVQHKHHHRHSDKPTDIHSPKNGLWMSLLGWAFSERRLHSVFEDRTALINFSHCKKDRAAMWASENFIPLNVVFLCLLLAIDVDLFFAAGVAILIEHVRMGLINTLCHLPTLPGNYRNHNTNDNSQNNILVGLLTLGFGWHNNHHNDPSKLILTENWWEIDVEGWIGKALGKL